MLQRFEQACEAKKIDDIMADWADAKSPSAYTFRQNLQARLAVADQIRFVRAPGAPTAARIALSPSDTAPRMLVVFAWHRKVRGLPIEKLEFTFWDVQLRKVAGAWRWEDVQDVDPAAQLLDGLEEDNSGRSREGWLSGRISSVHETFRFFALTEASQRMTQRIEASRQQFDFPQALRWSDLHVQLWRATSDPAFGPEVVRALMQRGDVFAAMLSPSKALESFQEAKALSEAQANNARFSAAQRQLAVTLAQFRMGEVCTWTENYEQAVQYLAPIVADKDAGLGLAGRASAASTLSSAYSHLNRPQEAIAVLRAIPGVEEALANKGVRIVDDSSEDSVSAVALKLQLVPLYDQAGDAKKADELMSEILQELKERPSYELFTAARLLEGKRRLQARDFTKAIESYQWVNSITSEIAQPSLARARLELAKVYAAQGQHKEAIVWCKSALPIFEAMHAPLPVTDTLDLMAQSQAALGQKEEARINFQKALALATSTGRVVLQPAIQKRLDSLK